MEAWLRIKDIRLAKDIKQKDLAIKSNISQSYLSELESNKKSPTIRLLCKIAEALDVHPSELVYYYNFLSKKWYTMMHF